MALAWARRGGAVVSLLMAGSAVARPPPPDPRGDEEIEVALPHLAVARRVGRLVDLRQLFVARTDRVGRVLAAYSIAEDQDAWNAFHALSGFDAPEAWSEIGEAQVYLHWKLYDQARTSLRRARELAPTVAEALVLEGDLARATGDPAAAAEAYHAALALRPADVFALDGLGLLAASAGHADQALAQFSAARAVLADDAVAVRGLADAYLARGDPARALPFIDDLHRLTPSDLSPWVEAGKLRLKLGDPTGAMRDFEGARRLGSTDPDLLAALSETYRVQGKVADELKLLDALVEQGAAGAPQYERRAELRAASDPAAALRDQRKAVELAPGDPASLVRLARLTVQSGDVSTAIGLYRKALARQPTPEVGADLAALEKAAGLAAVPLHGTVAQINAGLSAQLNRLYHQQLKTRPALRGALKVRVVVDAQGKADSEEILEDGVKSPELAANLVWSAHDARYPALAARYVFKFAFSP